tara:strand:- start:1907 stop:2791 length:885 start_codon:yes stop_codon:yes gene_type:complete
MKKMYNISVIGQSNTGKSSLINYLSKKYVTAESNKLQTTRINLHNKIKINNLEINIIDTPGISLVKKDLLAESMKKSYVKTLQSIDLVILMIDINSKDLNYEESIMSLLLDDCNILIAINKIDLMENNHDALQKFTEIINDKFHKETFPISIKSEMGIDNFLDTISKLLEKQPPISNESLIPKNNQKLIMQEIIRGVIVDYTHNELPYDTAVLIDNLDEKKSLISLYASIYVSKDNQKKIIIGKGGSMIKNIGSTSRKILEENFNKKFFISLNTVVKDNWKNSYSILKKIGYLD